MSKTKSFKREQPTAERRAEGRRAAERRQRLEDARTREQYGHRELWRLPQLEG